LNSAAVPGQVKGAFGINDIQKCRIIYYVNEIQGFAEIIEHHLRIDLYAARTLVFCGRGM